MKTSLFVAFTLLALAPALAQTGAGTQQEQAACRADVRKFCAQVRANDNAEFKKCLQQHFSQLSQKCREVLMKH